MSESFSLKELYKNVEACKNTYEFKKIFVIDDCIYQSESLLKSMPENLRARSELQKAVVKTYERLSLQKTHLKKLNQTGFKNESDLMASVSGVRFSSEREQEAWSNYKLVDSQLQKGNSSGNKLNINFSSILIVISFFLFIYFFNLVVSGNWKKAKYIIQLRYFNQEYLADLIEKDLTQHREMLLPKSRAERKEDKKQNIINGLTMDERRFLNKIYKNIKLIDRAYTLSKIKNKFIEQEADQVKEQIEIILSDFYKKIDYVPLD
jgi:hypothetical protein